MINFYSSRPFFTWPPHPPPSGSPEPGSAPAQRPDPGVCGQCGQWVSSSPHPLGEGRPGCAEERQVEAAALSPGDGPAGALGCWELLLRGGK